MPSNQYKFCKLCQKWTSTNSIQVLYQNLKRYSLFGPSKTESSSNDHYTKSSPVCGSGKHLFSVQTLLTNLHAKRSQEQIFLTEDKKGEWREEDAKKRGFPILIYFFFAPSQYNYLKRDGPDR